MKTTKMADLTILLSVFGFIMWAFFQRAFIENSLNSDNATRLLFPIVVPILAGIFVYVGYVIFLRHTPNQFIAESFRIRVNVLFLILSAVGLALAYFLYTLLVSADSKNIVIIPVLNTVGLVVVAFFVTYEKDEFNFRLSATKPQIAGALITCVGVIVMKYGDSLFKR